MGFLSKLLMLLLKDTKVSTRHQKLPKMGQNSILSSFCCPKGKKSLGRSPPQELDVGPRSGPYLLVLTMHADHVNQKSMEESKLL